MKKKIPIDPVGVSPRFLQNKDDKIFKELNYFTSSEYGQRQNVNITINNNNTSLMMPADSITPIKPIFT